MSNEEFMEKCKQLVKEYAIEHLDKADAVVFMKGWENARGCRIEYQIAKDYGKFIKEEQ